MLGVLQRRFEQNGTEQQERLMLAFDQMFPREKNTALWELFHLWQYTASQQGGTPIVENFDYKSKLPETVRRYICWSDVTPSDPFNFVMHDHAHLTAFNNHSNRRVGDHPVLMNARACAAEYMHCIRTKQPTYYEIDQTFGNISRHMMRMMVPIADSSGEISRLVYAIRIISASELSSDDDSSKEI